MMRTSLIICVLLALVVGILPGCERLASADCSDTNDGTCSADPATDPICQDASTCATDMPEPNGALAAAGNMDFREVIRRAKARVFPATVFVLVMQESYESGRRISTEVTGSGVIISPEGEVVTNWHVVDKAVRVRCLLSDGTAAEAEVIGSDQDTDLALLQLQLPDDYEGELPFAEMGDSSSLQEGDFVMAMGAPWGLDRSVSMGIISCRDRYLEDVSEYSLWLQTDAAISPGNSGGPLVDTEGLVIGINTRGIMEGGDTGFAVPQETVELIIGQLREHGQVDWSWTGLRLQPLNDFNRDLYFGGDAGVIVADTDRSSPARLAGIQPRDRILAINGEPVTALFEGDLPAIQRQLALLPKYEPAMLTIERETGGETVETLEIEIIPREKGDVEGEELDCPRWNMTLKEINQFDNEDLYVYQEEGVFIFGIQRPGNAQESGLRESDIIIEIGGEPVTTLEDVQAIYDAAMDNIENERRIVVKVSRSGNIRRIVLDFSRDHERE
jgi:serine protease Do